jgi:hypothetical protein
MPEEKTQEENGAPKTGTPFFNPLVPAFPGFPQFAAKVP